MQPSHEGFLKALAGAGRGSPAACQSKNSFRISINAGASVISGIPVSKKIDATFVPVRHHENPLFRSTRMGGWHGSKQ